MPMPRESRYGEPSCENQADIVVVHARQKECHPAFTVGEKAKSLDRIRDPQPNQRESEK